ncbi:spore coat protein CotJB [Clostridium sp. A1-XYC3]|uniref:Spore coat protein CotJB n=1 Tax=Clostridium tanneri TaxID=3037988 RepID=A0ABU4JYK7_9CLOT|nr:spore coat protein CotJB [Clostridium sp. A1-XYC3]MDW8802986.1 spore coat protein CotJB [Clostridium sp. A1-XYC3]
MNKEMSKKELLRQITAVNFVLVDLHLYLNTHPNDREALAKHNSLAMQSRMLRENYERCFGPLSYGSCSAYPWQWINEPWPWECEANFKLYEEEM